MRNLPLRLRVPNAPPGFVGRSSERSWMKTAIERAPVTLVVGDGGMGKSALVLRALHEHFAERVDSALFVAFGAADASAPPDETVLRALAQAEHVGHVDWLDLRRDPESVLGLAIDLAERGERFVVLDDAHVVDERALGDLVDRLARYARKSRWIVTTRRAPVASAFALEGQRLDLGPLPSADLEQLAGLFDPRLASEARRELAKASRGSPWQLRRLVAGGSAAAALDDLGDTDRKCVRALATLGVELPNELSSSLVGIDEIRALDLERRGLVERSPRGVRLSARARDIVEPFRRDDPAFAGWARETARALAALDDPTLSLEAVRLAVASADVPTVRGVLDRRVDALLDAGYAGPIHALLASFAAPGLHFFRARVALATDDPTALATLSKPEGGTPAERRVWATVLLAQGRIAEAADEAQRAFDGARETDDPEAFDAGIVAARCLANLRRHPEALVLLEACVPRSDAERAEREMRAALSHGDLGDSERMMAAAARAERALASSDVAPRRDVVRGVALMLYNAGHLREAARFLDEATAHERTRAPRSLGRLVPYLRACLAIDSGDLARGSAELDALAPSVGALLRPYYANARAIACLVEGGIDEAERWLSDPIERDDGGAAAHERIATKLAHRLLTRRRADDLADRPSASVVFSDLGVLRRARLDLHLGDRSPDEIDAALPSPRQPELVLIGDLVRAESALLRDEPERALELALGVAARAEAGAHLPLAAEALATAADALLVLGDARALEGAVDRLDALARSFPSRRFAAVARWFRATIALDVAALEAVAHDTTAPDVAARARVQLGEAATIGLVDRHVLDAHARRSGWSAPNIVSRAPDGESWGIDLDAGAAWLPNGKRVDLSKHQVAMKILAHLAACGGSTEKEAMVRSVWGERSYHPLRHDNRLQAVVRKLRLQIEDDPSAPIRLVTTEEGYALGGTIRVVRTPSPNP